MMVAHGADDGHLMSSLVFPRETALARGTRGRMSEWLARMGVDTLLAAVVLVLFVVVLTEVPADFINDSWLALVTGRDVWQHGIPHQETLTALSLGHTWIDQQWLSQAASYAVYLLGGFGLLGLVNAVLLVGSVGGAVFATRRLGAPFLSVLVVLPACIVLIDPAREVRTQTFVIPLFTAVAFLLARDARRPSRAVYWCLPILVLWANLHGTVTLGAGLVGLRGLTVAWERRHELRRSARSWRRPGALMLGAPLAILLTPYGLGIIGYYRSTMVGGSLRQAVIEWQPITSQPLLAAAALGLTGLALWSFGRNPERTTPWERIAIIVLAAGSVSVVRNVLFLGLLALIVVPVSLDLGGVRDRARGRQGNTLINGSLLGLAVLVAAIVAVATVVRPASSVEFSYQRPGVLTAVRRAMSADPSLKIMADTRFTDWLLWRDRGLDGHVAADARFELLSPAQLSQLDNLFSVAGTQWKQLARGDRLLVLDRRYEPETVKGFLAEAGRRILYNDGHRLVILRTLAAAQSR
jgi:hypothetical protein